MRYAMYITLIMLMMFSMNACDSPNQNGSTIEYQYPFHSWEDIDGEYFIKSCGKASLVDRLRTGATEWYEEKVHSFSDPLDSATLDSFGHATHHALLDKYPLSKVAWYSDVKSVFRDLTQQLSYDQSKDMEIYVLKSAQVNNAFAVPPSNCYITTGLLEQVKNRDEMAFVLGHEISHLMKEHIELKLRQRHYLIDKMGEKAGLMSSVIMSFVTSPFNIGQEYEADQGALWLMARAGYDPEVGMMILNRWSKRKSEDQLSFYSTHPKAYKRFSCCATLTAKAKMRANKD